MTNAWLVWFLTFITQINYRQYCHVGNTAQPGRLGPFQDSDFARDPDDSKSTSSGLLSMTSIGQKVNDIPVDAFRSRWRSETTKKSEGTLVFSRSCWWSEMERTITNLKENGMKPQTLMELKVEQLYKVSSFCLDDCQFKLGRTRICWWIVRSLPTNSLEMLVFDKNWRLATGKVRFCD